MQGMVAALLATVVEVGPAAEPPGGPSALADRVQLDQMAGQPVDIAPWGYAWGADRAVQEKPEANFIPRRLERIDKVYRTASTALPWMARSPCSRKTQAEPTV